MLGVERRALCHMRGAMGPSLVENYTGTMNASILSIIWAGPS